MTHICDVESNEPVHVLKFQRILSEMKDAQTNKRIPCLTGDLQKTKQKNEAPFSFCS